MTTGDWLDLELQFDWITVTFQKFKYMVTCSRCNEEGHNRSSCPLVNTVRHRDRPEESTDEIHSGIQQILQHMKKMRTLQNNIFNLDFSNWTLPQVLNHFSILEVPTLHFTQDCEILQKHLDIAKEIQFVWNAKTSIFGVPTVGPGRKKSVFIADVIAITLSRLEIPIKVKMEDGSVDYVFNDGVDEKAAMLIETKKDDFDQGEAQILLALHAAEQNRNVFGFVSNAVTWCPYV
jgi:hypothetical protein